MNFHGTCMYYYTMCTTCVYYSLAFFGLFGGGSDDDDDPTKVPPSVKRYLLKAHRYRRSGAYQRAERACHQALEILATSKHSSSQIYTEARAYVLDTVSR